MTLSYYALKLLAWLRIYKIGPTAYQNNLATHPAAQRRGLFATALAELTTYETNYGYLN